MLYTKIPFFNMQLNKIAILFSEYNISDFMNIQVLLVGGGCIYHLIIWLIVSHPTVISTR